MSKAVADTLAKVAGEFESEVTTDLEAGRAEALTGIESVRKETAETVSKILETAVKQAVRRVTGRAATEVALGSVVHASSRSRFG